VQTSLKTKSVETEPRDVLASAEQRRRGGLAVAERIWKASEHLVSKDARARAYLVGRCSDSDNVWTSQKLLDAEGREFGAFGVKSSCGSLLCPFCIKTQQRRCEKRLVAARDEFWRTHDREVGKYERFVTLTAPTLQGVVQVMSEKIFNRAYELLSDRPFYARRVDAGAKHIEFTINSHGYHTHIHLLLYGSYMERDAAQQEKSRQWREVRAAKLAARGMRVVKDSLPPLGNLQDNWTACIDEAAREFDHAFDWRANYDESLDAFVLGSYSLLETRERIVPDVKAGCYMQFPCNDGGKIYQPTPAQRAGVDVRAVREKGQPSTGEIGLTKAIKELTKYITKAASWSDVSDNQLVEIAEVRRWPRRFELLGAWRKTETDEEKQRRRDAEDIARAKASRKIIHIMPGEKWIDFTERLEREDAHPDSYVIAWDRLIAASMAQESEDEDEKARVLFLIASLDTDFISRSGAERDGRPPPGETPKRQRQKSLMALSDEMPFDEWQKIVLIRLAGVRQTRTGLLARKYPYATFECLDGTTFEGIDNQAEWRASRIEAIYQTWHGQY
jgi:hypothetical protein